MSPSVVASASAEAERLDDPVGGDHLGAGVDEGQIELDSVARSW